MKQRIRAVTLLELLIGITLFTVIALVLSTMDLFSRHHVLSSERQVRLQNDASYILEHMSKQISRAIGNERVIAAADSVVNTNPIGPNNAIQVYIDQNANGQRDTIAGGDRWIAYRFTGAVGPVVDRYQVRYCPQYDPATTGCTPAWGGTPVNILSTQINFFQAFKQPPSPSTLNFNFVEIQLTACWDPAQALGLCGTPANPSVTMRSRINMPSVSTN